MDLTTTVTPDLANGIMLLALHGELTLESVPTARTALITCLAQTSDAVLVNLAQMWTSTRSLLAVFPSAARSNGNQTTALLLYGASAGVATLMASHVMAGVPVYDTLEHALAAVTSPPMSGGTQRTSLHLAPTPMAAATARKAIRTACQSWDIDQLAGPATLVISELVSNAVQHAGTEIDVTAAHRGHYLHLSVHDGDRDPPVPTSIDPCEEVSPADVPARGRGLYFVDVCATAWGCRPARDGKTIWATLRASPIAGTSPA